MHTLMSRQSCTSLRPQAWHHVQSTVRQTCLVCKLCKSQGRQAGFFSGFKYTCIACSQCSTNRPSNDLHRVIPWDYMSCHAVWLSESIYRVAVKIWNGLPMQLIGCSCVKLHIARKCDYISCCLFVRFSNILRF